MKINFYDLRNFFLKIDLSQSIKNLQILATEMYKILNGLSPDIMQDIFKNLQVTTIILVMRKHFP